MRRGARFTLGCSSPEGTSDLQLCLFSRAVAVSRSGPDRVSAAGFDLQVAFDHIADMVAGEHVVRGAEFDRAGLVEARQLGGGEVEHWSANPGRDLRRQGWFRPAPVPQMSRDQRPAPASSGIWLPAAAPARRQPLTAYVLVRGCLRWCGRCWVRTNVG
jgi:hypothetical protein